MNRREFIASTVALASGAFLTNCSTAQSIVKTATSKEIYSTGMPSLDWALDGGFRKGSLVLFYGFDLKIRPDNAADRQLNFINQLIKTHNPTTEPLKFTVRNNIRIVDNNVNISFLNVSPYKDFNQMRDFDGITILSKFYSLPHYVNYCASYILTLGKNCSIKIVKNVYGMSNVYCGENSNWRFSHIDGYQKREICYDTRKI